MAIGTLLFEENLKAGAPAEREFMMLIPRCPAPAPAPHKKRKQEKERKQIRKRKKTGSNRLDKQKRIRVETNHKQ